jgi:hypothetical protein
VISCKNANITPARPMQSITKRLPTCHHCGMMGHIRPNFGQLNFSRTWNKKDATKKDKDVEKGSKSKYVPPHKRQPTQRFVPTFHHCGISGHIRPNYSQLRVQKPKVNKELPKKETSGTRTPKAHQASWNQRQQQKFVPTKRQSGKHKNNKSRHFKKKPQEPHNNHVYEGLLSMMQNVLSCLDNLGKAHNPAPMIKKVWVKKDETIHPVRGSGLT